MSLTKKNLENLDMNQGHLVYLIPDWVGFQRIRITFKCHDF